MKAGQRVILDTDVASLSIKNRLPPQMLLALIGAEAGITFVPLGELTRRATMRQWGTNRRAELESWLAVHPTMPDDDDVARTWGDISARASRRGRPRPQNDTWIAACCLVYELPLATFNVKDRSSTSMPASSPLSIWLNRLTAIPRRIRVRIATSLVRVAWPAASSSRLSRWREYRRRTHQHHRSTGFRISSSLAPHPAPYESTQLFITVQISSSEMERATGIEPA